MSYKLRDYQEKAVDAAINFFNTAKPGKKGVVVLPCGTGKSLVVAEISKRLGVNVLNLQPSKELLEQNYDAYTSYGLEASIYSASMNSKEVGEVTFATPLSLRNKAHLFKDVKCVVVDEAHEKCRTGSIVDEFISQLPKDVKVIGLTATPVILRQGMYGAELRMLNRTRDSIFQEILYVMQIEEAINQKWWCPLKYEEHKQDTSMLSFNSSGSEYTDESLQMFFFKNDLDKQITDAIERNSDRGQFLVFVPTIAAAEALAKKIPGAQYIHSKLSATARKALVLSFKNGVTKVMINVNILATGFNMPHLPNLINASPTASISRYYQQVGRVVRPHPLKTQGGLIIDMAGNFERFGKVENLRFEQVQGIGWCVTNNGYQISERPIKAPKRKVTAITETVHDDVIWFGKYKGTAIHKIPVSYMEFCLREFDFKGEKMIELKEKFLREVVKQQEFVASQRNN